MSLALIMKVTQLVAQYGVPATAKIIGIWSAQHPGGVTLQDNEKLAAIQPPEALLHDT